MLMSDQEFEELIDRLYRLGLNDGDIGAAYWTKVINELKLMRNICLGKPWA